MNHTGYKDSKEIEKYPRKGTAPEVEDAQFEKRLLKLREQLGCHTETGEQNLHMEFHFMLLA